ncbi:hypothetical protein NF556_16580 [Ornithinimicrobium faecis]|uniref:ABC-2 type transport system permease protein n=1 Tax=Ornithinimicrobium faecis TaxID=2934158 RepID=A0ABY4YRL2_9MICO|nr:hypothetical protein [Ornithinimicrobium sp. HY1793]USQ79217.1 hypothetical protein NF556_16580 [Ornithinimicrobium sp. HY1793]
MTATTTTHAPVRSEHSGRTGSPSLAGTGTLVRFLLRRDRIKLPAWVGGLGLFVIYIGSALPQLAPTQEDLRSLVTLFTQPVGRMFTGPAFGMDAPTYERFFAAGYAPYLFLLAGLMNIMLITRHTRLEEQTGRAELVRANVTGRYAALAASLIVALITNGLATAVVTGLALAVGFAPTGSLLVGLGVGLTGLAFAGVTAVTVQLSEYSRTAAGMAGAVLAASFVMRALGDMAAVGGSALSWVSPLGWPSQAAPYVHDRWATLLLPVCLTVVTVTAAYVLLGRRDFGASLVAARPGTAVARPWLGTPLGLAARLQRGGFLGWGVGIALLGIVDGAFTQAMIDAGEDMPAALKDMFGTAGLVDGYVAFLGAFVSVLIAAYTVFAMQTLRAEELSGRAELVLSARVGRAAWLGSHTLVVALGAVLISVATGLLTGVAAAAVTGDWSLVGGVLASHVVLLPGVLLVLAVCAALAGWAPRLMAPIGWVLVALSAVVNFFGELLSLPDWLVALSPFSHLAGVPVEPFEVLPFLVVLVLAVAVSALALVGMRRRQVNAV